MLFSHVKISSFRAKAHVVFHWCLYHEKKILSLTSELRFTGTFSEDLFPNFSLAKVGSRRLKLTSFAVNRQN